MNYDMKKYAIQILNSLSVAVISITLNAQTETGVMFRNVGLVNVQSTSNTNTLLYIQGNMEGAGQSKIYIQKSNVRLTGDLINNSASGYHVFAGDENETNFSTKTDGSFEFAGTSPQQIRGNANKSTGFAYFPRTTLVNNRNASDWKVATVTLSPTTSATMTNLTYKSGRLVIDSEALPGNTSIHAHLLLKGAQNNVMYYDSSNPDNDWGGVQVNLAVGANQGKRIFGFASPFVQTYADYFMFNFLSAPSSKGLFGDNGRFITNPTTFMEKGKGYIVGMGLVDETTYYNTMLDPQWSGAKYADRSTTVFRFGGFPYYGTNSIQAKTTAERYTQEVLNTSDIFVTLNKGFNYVGNSYTAPLDMTSFTGRNNENDPDWKVLIGPAAASDVKNAFYVLSNGTGAYLGSNNFTLSASWLLGQKVGGTYQLGTETRTELLIPPMQMFVLWSNNDNVNLTLPASKRTHGIVNFLRSTESAVRDEILIESRDIKTGGFDRLCVVFRTDASLAGNDLYDAPKLFNRSGGVNQIYTHSSDGKEMTTTVVPQSTQKLAMYFEPSGEEQEVEMEAYRLESLQSVYDVVLEDTRTGEKADLLKNPIYRFTSTPGDNPARFVLHFNSNLTGIEESGKDYSLLAYYTSGITTIQGLQDNDLGNDVTIYNIQGQLLHKQKITEINSCRIYCPLATGVYIVKVGNNHLKLGVNQ